MKKLFACLVGIALIISAVPVFAGEKENLSSFQGGLTYIRYRLNHESLPVRETESLEEFMEEDSDTTTFTLENGEIDEIDAYFELAVPDFTLDDIYNVQYNYTETVSWDIGDAAVALDYNRIHKGNMNDHLLDDEHLIRGKLNVPLGESGFSLGAYLAMYTASDEGFYEIFIESPETQGIFQTNIAETPGVHSAAQAAFAGNPADQDETMNARAPASKVLSSRKAVLGAVNFSGAVKGVAVFTEVGFASETGEHAENTMIDEINLANFYALGGAKYPLGQITLGVEAGFENSGESIDNLADDFPGFENNFWFDSVIEEDIPGDELTNKLYAKVSASMQPAKKISVEGAFSCVKPVETLGETGTYGFEVNGAFYYSLANYVKYILKAGVASSLEDSVEDSQYKLMNRLEFKF